MSLIEVNGIAVVGGDLKLPRTGRWVAELALEAAPPAVGAKVTIKGPGLSLAGFVAQGGSFVGTHRVRLCAGAGGLHKAIAPQHFRNMPISLLLDDALGAVGERRSATIDSAVTGRSLPSWARPAGPASRAITTLAELAGVVWRVLPDGTVWLGEDTWRASAATGEVLDTNQAARSLELALDTMSIWPGTTFGGLRVETVVHTISDTGFRTEIGTQ